MNSEVNHEAPSTSVSDENNISSKAENKGPVSALQDNIERKGKNAYYFAHARKVRFQRNLQFWWCLCQQLEPLSCKFPLIQ